MKKLLITLAMGSSALSFADEALEMPSAPTFESAEKSQHELYPTFKMLRHKEFEYDYDKIIGGVQYNYSKDKGMNFNSFLGYSIYDDKSYFTADWGLKYIFNYNETIDLYPRFTMSSISHFDTSNALEAFQIYRSTFDGGMGIIYKLPEIANFDLSLSWFKDLATTCIVHRGNDFWGKNYYSPSGLKVGLDVRIPALMSKTIEIGGFYARTIKDCYEEFGIKTSVVFAF